MKIEENIMECLARTMQKAGYVNKEYLVKILLHCLFPKLMYSTCCTFGVRSILNPLNVAFNDGFRTIFNIADIQLSVRMIVNGFSVLPVSMTFVVNLLYMIQNMTKIDTFLQLIAHLFLKFDCYCDLCNVYNINIHMCKTEIKLQQLYE